MKGLPLHTQFEVSIAVFLEVIFVTLLWFGTTRSVPKTVGRLAGQQGRGLDVSEFRYVVHMRDAHWLFSSFIVLAACDGWLTFGGDTIVAICLWAASASLGLFGTVVGLEGQPPWATVRRFRGGMGLLSNSASVRLGWYRWASFRPSIWLAAFALAYAAVFVTTFVLAPSVSAVPGLLLGAVVPFWCLVWFGLPIAPTLRTAPQEMDVSTLWPDWVLQLMSGEPWQGSPAP